MSRWLRRLASTAVALLIAPVLFELLALGLYFANTGSLYYRSRPATDALPAAAQIPEAVFHPYLGYLHRPGRKGEGWDTNNVGFQVSARLKAADPACCDYPLARKPGELLVGIFGGSNSAGIALEQQDSGSLARLLGEMPAYRGKTVRILNFAMPGFHQPQPLLTLAYFLSLGQQLDIAIEIDGFTEAVTSFQNWKSGAEPSFPADVLWGAWGRQLEQDKAASGAGSADRYLAAYYDIQARTWQRRAAECTLAGCNLLAKTLSTFSQWRGSRLDRGARPATEKSTIFPTAIKSRLGPDFDVYAYAADRLRDSSIAMAELARARGIMFLQVLQPNQWWRESGDYHPIAPDHPYGWVIEPVNRTYPQFVQRLPQMRAAGVAVLDATMLFRGRPDREIYVDDCCHYTATGNDLLMHEVAKALAAIQADGGAPPPAP